MQMNACAFSELKDIDPTLGYHCTCYSRFTDKTKVERAVTRKLKSAETHEGEKLDETEDIPSTPSPKKRLRSSRGSAAISGVLSRTASVLPDLCIICTKKDLREGPRVKRVISKLMQAETYDAGMD